MAPERISFKFFQNYQRPNVFFSIAGVSGAAAIALGAYGSHSKILNLPENEDYKKSFETASKYHFLHNVVLLALPLMKRPNLVGSLLVTGQLMFCGSLYVAGFTRNLAYRKPAPYGAMILIAAWIAMAF